MTDLPIDREIDVGALEAAGVPRRYLCASWDEVTPEILEQLHDYCENIDINIREGRGMTLLGPYGTGKSFASVLALDAALAARGKVQYWAGDDEDRRPIYEAYECAFVLASEMSVILHRPSDPGHEERIRVWRRCDLLVVDDWHKMYLGAEWDRSQLEAVMDVRHAELLATILTINDLKILKDLPGVADRLRETSELIQLAPSVQSRRGR